LLLGLSARLAWYCGACGHERTAPSFAPGGGRVVSAHAACSGQELPAPRAGILLLGLSAQLAWYCGACGHERTAPSFAPGGGRGVSTHAACSG